MRNELKFIISILKKFFIGFSLHLFTFGVFYL
nr:MAG TPA: hypothetical protein [Caudoviricetes sp.]DAN13345.1 MAG TPA: hypothetical protein [Caudoviricetes sp.]DAR03226.1 MAG TPA: hypothetical protein [Caudoviricetes sp.]DAR28802.1 MAG TPA: hypothetical protein [Caudoviricetes sp.]